MPRGRAPGITQAIVDGIVLRIRAGVPMRVAAESQGIAESTLFDWIAAGEGRPSRCTALDLHRELSERVRVARAEAHVSAVTTIRSAISDGNWQAALAWIRLRYPEHYAERMEVSGPENGPIAVEIAQALEGLTEEELASIESHLATGAAPRPPHRRRTGSTD